MTPRSRIFDCFLYNDEVELLELRLRLLSPVVDVFVVVWAAETFTGLAKDMGFPWHSGAVQQAKDKIRLVQLDRLEGQGAWEKETFSRNALMRGLDGAGPDDLVVISDVDELPRPAVLSALGGGTLDRPLALGLDYFNFKLNYKMMHGMDAVWAGPVAAPMRLVTSPQALRKGRWADLHGSNGMIQDAGWHFSFLSRTDDVQAKLRAFSHQERSIQARAGASVAELIERRQGFRSHICPGDIWAVVGTDSYGCAKLTDLVAGYPELVLAREPDPEKDVAHAIRLSVSRMATYETAKMVLLCSARELAGELVKRAARRLGLRR